MRRLTREQIEDQRRGSIRIAPGIWQDRHGAIHFSITELLELVDLPNTRANQEQVRATIRAQLEAQHPGLLIVEQEPAGDD